MDKWLLGYYIQNRCIKEGDFTLSSGSKSNWICDLLEISPLFPSIMQLLVFPNVDTILMGIEFGGALLAATYKKDFGVVRKDGSVYSIRDLSNYEKIIIVDDVVTTGSSLLKARDAIELKCPKLTTGGQRIYFACVLDRRENPDEKLGLKSILNLSDLAL